MKTRGWVLPGFALLLLLAMIYALGAGRFGVGWIELGKLLSGQAPPGDTSRWSNVFFQIRLPRILAAGWWARRFR